MERGPSAPDDPDVMNNQNSPTEPAGTQCRKCQQPIEPRSEEDILDSFRSFLRLRCTAADCGHTDWYKDVYVASPAASVSAPMPQEPGEVWIHDVFSGQSFKAETQQNL